MSNLSNEQEILLKEYREAGVTCRNHDQLIRTGFSIFAAVQAAIIGFIGTRKETGTLELVLLEGLGLWLSVVVLLTTLRLHYRYKTYMERARYIERQLGMNLYQYSFDYFGIHKIPGQWAGNKKLWASVPCLTFLLYTVLLLRDGPKLITFTGGDMKPILVDNLQMIFVVVTITLMVYVGGVRLFLIDLGCKISDSKRCEEDRKAAKEKLNRQTKILNRWIYFSLLAPIGGLVRVLLHGFKVDDVILFGLDVLLIVLVIAILMMLIYLHIIVEYDRRKSK